MTKSEIIKLSIQATIAVLLLVLLLTMCGRNKSVDSSYKDLVAAKDTIIKKEREKMDIYERLIEEKDKTYQALVEKDSILSVSSDNIEKSINQINDKLKVIPGRIARISGDNDSLRSEFSKF